MTSRATVLTTLAACLTLAAAVAAVLIIEESVGAEAASRSNEVAAGPATLEPSPVGTGKLPTSDLGSDAERASKGSGQTELAVPAGSHALIWVRQGERIPVRTEPRGGEVVEVADRRTEFKSPTVFGVVREQDGWAAVSTPKLPNGQLGWIRLDGDRLKAGSTRMSIVFDLSERVAELRDGAKSLRSFAVTVGAPGMETPTGQFAVTDTFRGGSLNPVYGCCALALSATQPSLPSGWLGGNRIAIHGTTEALGTAASHGCVRAADSDVSALVKGVPLGTPVFIRN